MKPTIEYRPKKARISPIPTGKGRPLGAAEIYPDPRAAQLEALLAKESDRKRRNREAQRRFRDKAKKAKK